MITTKLIAYGAAAAIAVTGAFATWTYFRLQSAQVTIANVERERDEAGQARDAAIRANATNLETIDQLLSDKLAIEQSLSRLEADRRRNQQLINNLSTTIRSMATDPANQVELSPVLKQTVDAIQRQRQERNPQ